MKELFQSIHKKYRDDTTGLRTTLSGGLHLGHAPQGSTRQGSTRPYGVYNLISNTPDEGFNFIIDDATIQIDLYSKKRSPTEICNIYNDAKDLYDWCTLSTTGSTQFSHISMNREFAHLMPEGVGDNITWRYVMQYRVLWQSSGNKP